MQVVELFIDDQQIKEEVNELELPKVWASRLGLEWDKICLTSVIDKNDLIALALARSDKLSKK